MASLGGLSTGDALVRLVRGFGSIDPAEASWLAFTESLLRFCRDHGLSAAAFADRLPGDLPTSIIDGLEAEIGALLGSTPMSYFADAGRLGRLGDFVAAVLASWATDDEGGNGDGGVDAVLVARAIAGAVEQRMWKRFLAWFRSQTIVELGPDRIHPVGRYDPTALIGRSANTRPTRLPTHRTDQLEHLRLGDRRSSEYRVTLNFDLWNHLEPFARVERLRIATVHPNLTLAEFRTEPDVDELRAAMARGEHGPFRNLGPRAGDAQHETLVALVRHAADLLADVIVIPEYCLATAERERLCSAIEELPRRPSLVVAGSSEVTREPRTNEGWLVVPDRPGLSLQKVFPAEVASHYEEIASQPEITAYWTARWVISVLICRDAMAPDIVSQLGDLGVNLLLVPAFSDRTGSLVASACTLRTVSQAFVAVAVAPARWTFDALDSLPAGAQEPATSGENDGDARVEAAFDGPYEAPPHLAAAPGPEAPGRGPGVGLWLFDAFDRTLAWHDGPPHCNQCQ
jgi:hypothetical protein